MKLTQSTEKDYLFSENPIERAFGRLQATNIINELHAYVTAETARGTEPEDLVVILANYFVSFHASCVGSWFEKSEINRGKKVLQQVMDSTYRRVALISYERTQDDAA